MMQTKSMLHSTTHATPVGRLTLVASDRGLRAVLWPKLSPQRAGISPRPHRNEAHAILRKTVQQLNEYFAVPFGATTTYGQQAAALGIPTAARAVGAANGANPVCIVLPCHRVIGADGSLTGFGGGLPVKQWLLDHEAQVLSTRTIVSTPSWPLRQPVQTRLSMPVA